MMRWTRLSAAAAIPALAAASPAPGSHAHPAATLRQRLDEISGRLEALDARVEGVLDRIEMRLAIVEVELICLGGVTAPPAPPLFVDAPPPEPAPPPAPDPLQQAIASPGLFADLAEHAAGIRPAASPASIDVKPLRLRPDRAELIVPASAAASLAMLLLVPFGCAATARRIYPIRPP